MYVIISLYLSRHLLMKTVFIKQTCLRYASYAAVSPAAIASSSNYHLFHLSLRLLELIYRVCGHVPTLNLSMKNYT